MLLRTIATVHSQPTIATSTRSAWSRYELPVPAVYIKLEGPSPNYGSKIILALLDSGAHSSMILREHVEGLRMSKPALPNKWSTPGKGTFQTKLQAHISFTILETTRTSPTPWTIHVARDLSGYGMLIGRDLLDYFKINIHFTTRTSEIGLSSIAFKRLNETDLTDAIGQSMLDEINRL